MKIIAFLISITMLASACDIYASQELTHKTFGLKAPLTLYECYKLALKQSETVAIDAERIKETEAHFLQAISIMLPHASFMSSDMQESIPNDEGSTLSTLKPTKSSTRNFNVNQTLFNGFKAFAAIKGSKAEYKQRTNDKIRAEQLLLVDVSDAFYLLAEKRQDIKALRKVKKALIERVVELRQRENLGRSRKSEVVNVKAQLSSVESSIELVKNQETVARQLMEYLTGAYIRDIADTPNDPPSVRAKDYYISRSSTRPDVIAAKYALDLAKDNVVVANADFLPSVDVEANYYTQRTGFNKGTDWDVVLKVDAPIFDGALTIGNVKEALNKQRESELEYQRIRRIARLDSQNAYENVRTAILMHGYLKKTLDFCQLNYYLQKKDYRMSLVNNLDVLAAIQTLEDAERNYIHALYETKRLYWRLRASIGDASLESLNDAV